MNSELDRVTAIGSLYKEQSRFDTELVRFRFLTLEPYLVGPHGLELGPADGWMTRHLRRKFRVLTIVDGAGDLLESIPSGPDLIKVHSLFEDFRPSDKFNSIIMEHILEHVAEPVDLLKRVREWVAPTGRIFVGVPNSESYHRLVAVKMGLLKNAHELNERDHAYGHRRVYSWDTLVADLRAAGLKVEKMDGVFFKPLSNRQIDQYWTPEMIEGFYQLGKDFPKNAAEILAVCSVT